MKQKLFVLAGNPHQIEDVHRRFGDVFEIVPCHTIGDVQRNLELFHGGAVLNVTGNGQPTKPGDVDSLIENIVHTDTPEKPVPRTLADRVDLLEQKIIESTLHKNRHHRKDTAAELGISRVTLYNKMKKFGMLN